MNAPDRVINLYDVFGDAEDDDYELKYTIQSGGNAAIFDGVSINDENGRLTLKFKADTPGTATVMVRATDTGGLFANDSFNVTVNGPPVLDLNGGGAGTGFSVTYAAGAPPVSIVSPALTLTDPNNTPMQSATVKIANLKHPGSEFLDATAVGGIDKGYNAQTGVLTLTGPASIANFQTVLRSVTYRIASGVNSPNTEERSIAFVVSDGSLPSNEPVSKVRIIAPRISLSATTSSGAIPIGGAAGFTVTITNNGGSNVDLENIKVTSTDVNDNCDKTIAGTLAPNASQQYNCQRNNVQTSYDNVFKVTANDVELGIPVEAQSTANVRVVSPIVVDIYHTTGENTLNKGQDANFKITVTNPTGSEMKSITTETTIQMYDVVTGEYTPPVPVPACSRDDIDDLAAGGYTDYSCTIPDVQASFRIRVDAAGYIGIIGHADFDTEVILVPDLLFQVSADPFTVNAGEPTPVGFTLTMTNRSNVPLTLTGLQSDRHGNLLAGLTNNTCDGIDTSIPENVTRTCSYEATITAEPPAFINSITATAGYGAGKTLTVVDEAIVIAGDFTPLDVSLVANPSSLVAPGGVVELTVLVVNNADSDLQLDELNDSVLGSVDGLGDCDIPQSIPANGAYTCTYPVTISDKAPEDVVTHMITAIAGPAQASATVGISITTEIHGELFLSVVSFGGPMGNGAGNTPCSSVQIMPNFNYYGLADDTWDFYRFTITTPTSLKVKISNFLSEGHLLVYSSGNCSSLGPHLDHSGAPQGTILPNREIDLGSRPAGTYYVAVNSTDANLPYNTISPYTLVIEATTP